MVRRFAGSTLSARVDWRLCFIADSEAAAIKDILRLVSEAIAGGVTLVQLRGKKWTGREFQRLGIEAARILRLEGIPLIINDRVDIALACAADGVHLGQEDLSLPYARKILGRGKLIGISVNTAEEAEAAEREGADYVGAGPVFATSSKNSLPPLLGLSGLQKIRTKVKIPILAIGGITVANATEVISAGADGVAVISAIAAAGSARSAARKLIQAIGERGTRDRSSTR
jgi:thiamine-phosphate pyrophosphorylase